MSRSEDLLEVARSMFGPMERGRTEADWRRAVSDACYALFHGILDHACEAWPPDHAEPALRDALRRSHTHRTMSEACKSVVSAHEAQERANVQKAWHQRILSLFPEGQMRSPVAKLSGIFVKLQEQRHAADYAALDSFTSWTALFAIGDAEEALRLLDGLPEADAAAWHFLLRTPSRDLRLG